MLGAILGDIVGSRFEWHSTKRIDFEFLTDDCMFTDDTVMTIAVGAATLVLLNKYKEDEIFGENKESIREEYHKLVVSYMQNYGKIYRKVGYGGLFRRWINSENPKPYGSFGNGSAMRTSSIGWLFKTLEHSLEIAEWQAEVTHNHPEGIKGAQAVVMAIWLARNNYSKEQIKNEIALRFNYNLERTLYSIRPSYKFEVSCQNSVPEAIISFLESESTEDAIRNAVSLGGDADTQGAIAGSIAEAFYNDTYQYGEIITKNYLAPNMQIYLKLSLIY